MFRRWRGRRIRIRGIGRNRMKFLLLPIIVLAIFSLLFMLVEHNLKPTIKSMAEAKANLVATEVINKAIYEKVLLKIDYDDLVHIHKDSQNRVALIQANSIKISQLIASTNLEIRESLELLDEETFEIPLGQALGSHLLASHGPRIKVKVIPVGEVKVDLIQDFYEAGINQTRHILYLNITVDIRVVVPTVTGRIAVNTKAPIAETIIVGSVPDTVVRLEGMDNLFRGSMYKGLDSLE